MKTPGLIDIGVNLTHESFRDDLPEVVQRARQAGVQQMIVTGTSAEASRSALELARRHPGLLFATAGVHPHHAGDFGPDTGASLTQLLKEPVVVAAGECGLDYCRNYSPHPAQRATFEAQLAIASAAGKPLFLHQREAHRDFLAMLQSFWPGLHGGVAHCFTDGPRELEAYVDLGLYIGVTGWICDERRSQPLREAVRELPLDRVLIETDAPYLLPRDLPEKPRSRRNEPALLPHVLLTLARYMQVDPDELAAATARNTRRLFRLAPAPGPQLAA
ncbi:MAG: TatD family hydrolase [Chromatiales bacterium]|nr:TatD family hydrolase [Chromatiales bacterium]